MTTFSEVSFSGVSTGLADVVERTAQSVVTVLAHRPVSGTVVAEGLILTAAHVLHADEVPVSAPDGRTLTARVVGRDPASDLALLKVDDLNAAPLRASAGQRVGELLVAVGRPGPGVQAALGLFNPPQRGWLGGWLDSGAPPFRGVSGGALVDAGGGLVGLLNAGLSRGSLLAVPAERALKVAHLLSTSGRVPRGFLGVATQPIHFPDDRSEPGRGERRPPEHREHGEHRGHGRRGQGWGPGLGGNRRREAWERRGRGGRLGLTIVSVEAGSPAAQAGLKVGDVLLALDGQPVRHPQELLRTVHERAGAEVTARILRGGEEQDVPLSIGER